jgi:hypothetical protein
MKKVLLINTDNSSEEINRHAKNMVDKGVITECYYVKDYAEEALAFFNVPKNDLGRGYYYSISEFVGIYLCHTDYFLYFMGDSTLEQNCSWIDASITKMNSNSKYKVATLVWNKKYNEAKLESSSEDNEFFIGFGFSDQCFLIRTKDFQASIYNEKNVLSERYPKYGGEAFEKRVDSWMRNHDYYRIVFKNGYYISKNLPRNKLLINIGISMGRWGRASFK